MPRPGSPGLVVNPRHKHPTSLALTSCAVLLFSLAVPAATSVLARVLDFDEVPEGTVLNEHYAFMGVHILANGTNLDEVIAAVPCETAVSAPHVLSFQALGECPSARDELGHFEVLFDQPQNQVAVTAVHRGPNTSAYLEAYGVDGFIDVIHTVPGAGTEGVPYRLELAPPPDRPRITRVLFGVERSGDSAFFDNLELDVVVPTAPTHWGTFKARWH